VAAEQEARHIVGMGGGGDSDEQTWLLYDYIFRLARGTRILYVPTASRENPEAVVAFYDRFRGRAQRTHLPFFPWPPQDLRELTLAQDVILVGGGNTANMLAIWRVHGFDSILREAWEGGIVLCGVSAGMICWFEAGVTDSFGPQLEGMRDGLGFLAGSACPHYDGEERRRPVYTKLVREGFPPGYATDDGAALHFAGTELAEVVACRRGAAAYRVEPEGESMLEARLLGQ
jgi:dipeptidase E